MAITQHHVSGRWLAEGGAIGLLGLALGALVVEAPGVIAVLVPGCFALVGLVALVRWLCADRENVATGRVTAWTLGAFVLHLVIGSVIWSNPTLTTYVGGDAFTYNSHAITLLHHWTSGAPAPPLPVGKEGFFYFLAGVYWVFGQHPLAGVVLNAAMSAAVIPILYDATRRLFGPDAARYIPPIVTVLPGFLLWGSQLLREAGVYFLIAVCINCAARLRQRTTIGPLIVLPLAASILATWRADVGLLVVGGLIVGLALGRSREGGGGVFGGVGAGALFLALVLAGGLGYSGFHFVTHTSLAQLNDIRANSSQAGSGFLANADVSTPSHALGYLPNGGALFLFGPFPWDVRGGRQLFGLPDALAWWFLLPSLWRGLRMQWRAERLGVLLLVVPALALTAILALLIANFGTVVRERIQLIVVLAPLLALGWSVRRPLGLTGHENRSHTGDTTTGLRSTVARTIAGR